MLHAYRLVYSLSQHVLPKREYARVEQLESVHRKPKQQGIGWRGIVPRSHSLQR